MKRYVERLIRGEGGLTLLELTVVAAILTLLAALTAAAVTGSQTQTRASARLSDVQEVQKAVDSYTGEHPQGAFPSPDGCLPGQTRDIFAPNPTFQCLDQGAATQEFIFNGETYVPLVWDNGFRTPEGVEKHLVADFVSRYPKHAFDRLSAMSIWRNYEASLDLDQDTVKDYQVADAEGRLLTATNLGNNPTVWVLDSKGRVYNLLPEGRY